MITTTGLIPLEIYELARHFSWPKITVLVLNIAIVVYLIARLRKRTDPSETKPVPAS